MENLQRTTKRDLAVIINHPYVELGSDKIRFLLQLFSHSFVKDYELRVLIIERAFYHHSLCYIKRCKNGLVFLCDSDRHCLCRCINYFCNPKTEINPDFLFANVLV